MKQLGEVKIAVKKEHRRFDMVAVPTAPCSYTLWTFPFGRYEMPPNPSSRERLKLQWRENSLISITDAFIISRVIQKVITTSYSEDKHRAPPCQSGHSIHVCICVQPGLDPSFYIFCLQVAAGIIDIETCSTLNWIFQYQPKFTAWLLKVQSTNATALSTLILIEKRLMMPIHQGHPHPSSHLTSPFIGQSSIFPPPAASFGEIV